MAQRFNWNRLLKALSSKQNLALLVAAVLLIKQTACTPKATFQESPTDFIAMVNNVHDGDTVRVTDNHGQMLRVRMAFIDAPETTQAYGIASRDALRQMIDKQSIRVQVIDTDQYGRKVARLIINGRDVNLAQVEQGNAWHYQSFAKKNQETSDYTRYETAQSHAQSHKIGLWKGKNPLAPWKYRQQKRQKSEVKAIE